MASYQTVKTGKEHCLSYHMFDFFFHLLSEHLFFFFKLSVSVLFFFSHRIWSVFSCVNHALCTRKGEWSPLREDKKKKKRLAAVGPTEAGREQTFLRDCCTDLRVSGCVRLEDMFFS